MYDAICRRSLRRLGDGHAAGPEGDTEYCSPTRPGFQATPCPLITSTSPESPSYIAGAF